ncbi:MAG TPA: ATP-binding cassette domain-containing protein [Oculatellaceae cyanobacterium]
MVAQQIHSRSVGAISAAPVRELSVHSISKRIGAQTILSDVSFAINPGEITALIGPSGAGKTTLLKALSLLDPPDSGALNLDGYRYEFPLSKRAAQPTPWPKVTVVFQQLFLWPHLTLRSNILLPLGDKLTPAKQALFEHLIERFKMGEFIDRYPNQASLGQRQRAALVRAMVLEPSYILLDEITSSLDVEQVASILSELRVMRDNGIGILLVTHLLQFAKEVANSVVFLERGTVLESGSTEIITNPVHPRVKQFVAMAQFAS